MPTVLKQIKPPKDEFRLGLEDFEFSVFPGTTTEVEIPILRGKHNIGMENDPELKAKFENYFGVKFDTPEGQEFLGNYLLTIEHEEMIFAEDSVEDQFKLQVLRANKGLGQVAMSHADLENSPISSFRFEIVDDSFTQTERVHKKRSKGEAIAILHKFDTAANDRILTLANYIYPHAGIGDNRNIALDKLTDFIEGGHTNVEKFIAISKLDVLYLKTVVMIKKAINQSIITVGKDGVYRMAGIDNELGKTEDDVIGFFTKVSNKDLLGTGGKDDLPYSLTTQLSQSNY
jgi:hypothetical protein